MYSRISFLSSKITARYKQVSPRAFLFFFLLAVLLILTFLPAQVRAQEMSQEPSPNDDPVEPFPTEEPMDPYQEEPMDPYMDEPIEMKFFRGRVLSVEDFEPTDMFATLEQEAEVLLTSGPYSGETVNIQSTYIEDDIYLNIYLEEGMDIILVTEESDDLGEVYLHDIARERGLYYLLAIFVFLLLIIGKMQGVKTLLTLIFTGLVIVRVILPLLLQGYEPIALATISASGIIVFTLLVIGGINAKSLSAIIGTVSGVLVAGTLALWVGEISYLTGFSTQEAQMLFFMEQPIDIRGLLFAGIIIGSLGAVTDVGMSVASAAAEIKEAHRKISRFELTKGALNVGRDIMGTMSNTLLLAYAGGATPLLLLMMGYEMEWVEIINMDLIATEFVRGMAGSIGLVTSIPITAAVAGILMGKK